MTISKINGEADGNNTDLLTVGVNANSNNLELRSGLKLWFRVKVLWAFGVACGR